MCDFVQILPADGANTLQIIMARLLTFKIENPFESSFDQVSTSLEDPCTGNNYLMPRCLAINFKTAEFRH